jgi:hypothetical protein
MSEDEVVVLRRDVKTLSDKTDRQHQENQKSQAEDRATFTEAMNKQRNDFQQALNLDTIERYRLESLIVNCVGDGQPGKGRLGQVEEAIETLKKFRWQALAAIFALLYVLEHLEPLLKH